jgi:hypothetical protein
MSKTTKFAFLITTDGSRSSELERLLASCKYAPEAAVFLLLQKGAQLSETVATLLPLRSTILYDDQLVPLSVARNRMLDALDKQCEEFSIDANTIVLLTDDDCWYPVTFFEKVPSFKNVAVCKAIDPESGKHFSTFDLTKRRGTKPLATWELMFYGVSISFLFRYGSIMGMRFKENIGLGNRISQGEESLFVMRLLKKNRNIQIETSPDIAVYHPWKFAGNSNNHRSLGYFLGWSTVRGYSFVLPFFLFLWTKYLAASLVRPRVLYWHIFGSLGGSFVKGALDLERIGGPDV